jgi:hypothetical protein
MLTQPFLPRKAASSSIISLCHHPALWIFHDTMPKIVKPPLTLIFRIMQQVCDLPFSLSCWPIHSLWKNVTMQPIDFWMCKTKNRAHSVDTHITHIETAFVHSIILFIQSYTHYWHSTLCLYVLSFASRSFIPSQFQINGCPCYLIKRWRDPTTFPSFPMAIYGMYSISLVFGKYSWTS